MDLSKDSSIYYCGLVLGGAESGALSQGHLQQHHKENHSDDPEVKPLVFIAHIVQAMLWFGICTEGREGTLL